MACAEEDDPRPLRGQRTVGLLSVMLRKNLRYLPLSEPGPPGGGLGSGASATGSGNFPLMATPRGQAGLWLTTAHLTVLVLQSGSGVMTGNQRASFGGQAAS